MITETIVCGYIEENCYLAGDKNELLCIDPGDDAEQILSRIEKGGYTLKYIVLTHCHYDHIGAVAAVKNATGAQLVVCKKEAENYQDPQVNLLAMLGASSREQKKTPPPDLTVSAGDVLSSGSYRFCILETPGHTSGSMCLLCKDRLFSGDTLFAGGMGRVDLPTGSMSAIISSIKETLFTLPEETMVYPGHGPTSTIGYEKKYNEVYEWERYHHE